MPDGISDRQRLRAEQIFFEELEQGVRTANREIIGARIPELNKDRIHAFAVMVGRLRASYLELAFQLCAAGDGLNADFPLPLLWFSLRSRWMPPDSRRRRSTSLPTFQPERPI